MGVIGRYARESSLGGLVVWNESMNLRRFFLVACLLSPVSACGGIAEIDISNTGGGGVTIGVGGCTSSSSSAGGSSNGGVTLGGSTGSIADADVVDASDASVCACAPGTWVLVGEVPNARDLGGIGLENGAHVACGALYRGAAPVGLVDQGCADFDRLGIRTVIDLRTDDERLASPDSDCVTEQATIVPAPMPTPYSVSPADYLVDLNTTASVALAFNALADESAYPIYFHCIYGRDRTGVLAAVILLALGATRDEVMTDYQLSVDGGVGAYPDSLNAVLDDIDQSGGIEVYLAAAGVPVAELAALRAKAIAR